MTCTEQSDLVHAYVDGLLTEAQLAELDEHLRQCASCAAEMEASTGLHERLLRDGKQQRPTMLVEGVLADVRRRADRAPFRRMLTGAAALAACIILAAWLLFRVVPADGTPSILANATTQPSNPEQPRLEAASTMDDPPLPAPAPVPDAAQAAGPLAARGAARGAAILRDRVLRSAFVVRAVVEEVGPAAANPPAGPNRVSVRYRVLRVLSGEVPDGATTIHASTLAGIVDSSPEAYRPGKHQLLFVTRWEQADGQLRVTGQSAQYDTRHATWLDETEQEIAAIVAEAAAGDSPAFRPAVP